MEELKDIKAELPRNANVSEIRYEASDIVLYTDSEEFFLDNRDTVKKLVSKLKKRVEVRPTSKLFRDPENAKKKIKEVVSGEAGLEDTIFQPSLGKVIIRAERPGKVIGNKGEGLREIRKETLWAPQVERVPAINSKIVDKARELTVEDPEFRKKFLHEVGEKIRLDKSVGDEWIRVSSLGGFRQVGRSCVLVQTEESNVLLDAGIDPSAEPGTAQNYPYLNAPELDLRNLDAVVLSHAHMDHCLTPDTPVTMANGERKPITEVEKGDDLKALNWETGELEKGTCTGTKEVKDDRYLEIKTPFNSINASGDHKFFGVKNLEVKEIEASNLETGDMIPRKSVHRGSKLVTLDKPDYRERIEVPETAKTELRNTRNKLGITQKEVSEQLGKGVNFVSDLENKYDSIYLENLKSMLELYKIDFKEFLENHDIETVSYPDELDREIAQLVGYFYGDGHKTGNRLRFTDKNKGCLQNYNELVYSIFNYRGNIRKHPDRTKNAYSLEINNVGIVRFLEQNFEGLYENGIDSTLPNKIRLGDHEVAQGFIKGLFDAEGDVNNQIRIAQSNPDARKQIQNLLSSINIKASNSDSNIRLSVSSGKSIRRFIEEVGSDHPIKSERLNELHPNLSNDSEEIIPVTSEDLHRVLEDAGMIGRVNGSPSYKELDSCLVDWYRRNPDSHATKKTVETLIDTLKQRISDIEALGIENISEARKGMSLTREIVAKSTDSTVSQIQLIEDRGQQTDYVVELESYIKEKLEQAIVKTRENIEKLENLLKLNLDWQKITSIEEKENEYGYLVDIRVDPQHNFIANDQVVHNCGMIPYLYKMGYDGPLYCTKPTRDIMIMMTLDYIGLAHSENNKAPYDSSAIKKAVKRTITPDYGEVTDITPDMRLTLKNSGHIIGSALTHLHIGEGLHNILYTGDYNYDSTEMLRPADTNFQRVETMITEATYGGRDDKQSPREESDKKFLSKMKQTLNKGGKVIVPVFAVGRSQEVLGLLSDEMDRKYFDYPVYIDGMINDVNALHTAYPEFLSEKVQDKVHKENSPFLKENIKAIGSHKERQEVYDSGPCIILTTSGMITGGPIMSYLKEEASNPDNSLIFVGYQAEGTLGRKIQSGKSPVKVNGEKIDINMDVSTVSGFSAHSDRQQIINYCKNLRSTPNRVLTNHGEKKKCFSLASTLHKILRIDTSAPQNLEANRLN